MLWMQYDSLLRTSLSLILESVSGATHWQARVRSLVTPD
jgi:hypothetical protein